MNIRFGFRLFLMLSFVCGTSLSVCAQKETVIDQVVAVVGQNIVKLSDIEDGYAQIRMRQGYENAFENRCNILEGMLITKLLVHKGTIDSVTVEDEAVEERVQEWLKSLEMQYGGREMLRQLTGYSYDELHDIRFDMTYEGMVSQQVQYKLTENVKITPAEVEAYFNKIPKDSLPELAEEYEVSEIVLKPMLSENERDRVRTELARLRERVLAGEKFSMLATLYSQDPGSSTKGGELGFFPRGAMVSEFEAAAFALKPGEVSPIIETQFGFHIIQLIERRGNMINVRHILLVPKVSSEDMLATRIRLDSIANQIRLGAVSFEDAARRYSEAPSKTLGGVVANQYTGNNRFSKEMLSKQLPGISVATMNVGDVSNATAMKDDEGKDLFRIVKLTRKYPAHKANLIDDYDKIYNAALQEAKNNKIYDWANKMIKNTYVHIADEFKDCQFQLNWLKK